MKSFVYFFVTILFLACGVNSSPEKDDKAAAAKYQIMQEQFARGWNTWNYRSLLSHVRLPEGLTINLGFKDYLNKDILRETMLGYGPADVRMGPHAWDGSYTSVQIQWTDLEFLVESAHDQEDLVFLVTPIKVERIKKPLLLVEGGVSWNKSGYVIREDSVLIGKFKDQDINIHTTHEVYEEYYNGGMLSPYLAVPIDNEIGVSTGKPRDLETIKSIVKRNRESWEEEKNSYGKNSEVYNAMQTVLAWNTIFDPQNNRVISPVSRKWSLWNRGYVIYLWDTYFAAYQAAALGQKEIAYANAVEMTRANEGLQFVPNVEKANGFKSRDRSQPPVGAMCVREVYRQFKEKWFLELLYEDLLTWNSWWQEKRDYKGLLCYGSTKYEPVIGAPGEYTDGDKVNGWFGASMESGWDGATLYKNVPFDKERNILTMWDVSLNSLYVMDCEALADIANVLGRKNDEEILRKRAENYRQNLQRLWDEETGYFRNKSWLDGEFSGVTSINGFYPMIAKAATEDQVKLILSGYFTNPEEFYGKWIIPTMAKSHYAYHDEALYWDSKIWPPVNFLIYLGLQNYSSEEAQLARKDLVQKSRDLLLLDWNNRRYVRENYDPETGIGEIAEKSDSFYHWGGLLGLMCLIEDGKVASPQIPL
ncbi:MAG: MGH1-like glycoside hydrolase domain-containing protein [Candidatus Cyclobacteriaceae bacterium M3_2C_046]